MELPGEGSGAEAPSGPSRSARLTFFYGQLTLEDLPGSMREIADLVGLSAVIDLMRVYGGVRVYVPDGKTRLPRDHWLLVTVGERAASQLCQFFGGTEVKVPRGEPGLRAARDRVIRRRFANGGSCRELALAFWLTETAIENTVRGVQRRFRPQRGRGYVRGPVPC